MTHLACPGCQTWIDSTPARCPWCNSSLGWMARHPEVVAALETTRNRRRQLEVTLYGVPGPAKYPCTHPLTLTTPDGDAWQFTFFEADSKMRIEHRGLTRQFDLPLDEEALDGRLVSARILLEADVGGRLGPIRENIAVHVSLASSGKVTFGRACSDWDHEHISVQDGTLALQHCAVVPDSSQQLWVIDLATATGTFLNGHPILAAPLGDGDVLQLGCFGWSFDAPNRCLVPLVPIRGADIRARGLAVDGRLQPLDLEVNAGELVAVVGPSGAGKSTLLHALLGGPGMRSRGTVAIGGFDVNTSPEQFRAELGFVSQEAALHRDLPVIEAAQFSALLRGRGVEQRDIAAWLRKLELPERAWTRPVGTLSGGELKRVRIAAELVGRPPCRCLLLDEPTSGLDAQRERRLMQILRTLSFQGCTVLVVTHGRAHLDWFDRVLLVQQGRLTFDGTPTAFRQCFTDDDLTATGTTKSIRDSSHRDRSSTVNATSRPGRRRLASAAVRGRRETVQLFRREGSRLLRSWRTRLLVPLGGLPLVFALLISVAVQAVDSDLLGFLAVLACIWMGGSLSLATIVDEREVVDYERLLFLHWVPYLVSKTLLLWGLAIVQALVFLVILQGLRHFQAQENVAGLWGAFPWGALTLCLVSCAAASLGLMLSAIAKWAKSKELALFLFPLVMMCQIVLSVQVHRPDGDRGIGKYRHFSWLPAGENGRSPAARLSYLTLSRHADRMLASFAYRKKDFTDFTASAASTPTRATSPDERRCHFWTGGLTLALTAIILPIVSGVILRLAESTRWQTVNR